MGAPREESSARWRRRRSQDYDVISAEFKSNKGSLSRHPFGILQPSHPRTMTARFELLFELRRDQILNAGAIVTAKSARQDMRYGENPA